MALQNEKNSRYLLRDWKPENPAFWKIKENILLEEISGYQSVVYFLPSVSGCYLAQLPLISIKSVLIYYRSTLLLTALPSVSGALLRVPYSFMVPIFGGRRCTVLVLQS